MLALGYLNMETISYNKSTSPQGSLGYLDPQYFQLYMLKDKSDVYRFGVVLIQLIYHPWQQLM